MISLRCLLVLLCLVPVSAAGENWPQWRGPHFDGISSETNLPTEFGPDKNCLWKLPLPGPAGASPVVFGDVIFNTAVDGDDLLLMAASTDGKELWRHIIGHSNHKARGDEGNAASPSPSTDGERVWAMMGSGDLVCYSKGGQELWHFNLQAMYGKFDIQFGMTSTPVLHEGKLFLQLLYTGGTHVICLDGPTGKEIWHIHRSSTAQDECEHSYASPVIYDHQGQVLLITHGGGCTIAHHLKDGSEVWKFSDYNPPVKYDPTQRFVASPLPTKDLVVAPSGRNGPFVGLNPLAKGDIHLGDANCLWEHPDRTPDVPSPLRVDDLVYLCGEDGKLMCVEALSGKILYYKRLHPYRHRSSPIYADGKIYVAARDGIVSVLKPGRELKVIQKNDLGEPISASPAVSGGRIYFRTYDTLMAIGNQ